MKFSPVQIQRLSQGMSQKKAAGKLLISQSYLSQIETYDVPMPQDILLKMTKLYNCTAKDLFPNAH